VGKNIGIFDLFKLYISGYALNVMLPAKLGDVATVGYLKMKGVHIGRSAAIILQTRILLDHAIKNLFTLGIDVPATASIGVGMAQIMRWHRINKGRGT